MSATSESTVTEGILASLGVEKAFLEQLNHNSIILDYGCGQGEVSRCLIRLGYRVISADIDSTYEATLRATLSPEEENRLTFHLINAHPNALQNKKEVDAIICREVLEHLPDPEETLRLFSTLIKRNGVLLLSVPTEWSERFFSFFDSEWLKKSEHLRVFSNEDIAKALIKYNFFIYKTQGLSFRWTAFWMILSPFRVSHRMGNPIGNNTLVRLAKTASAFLCAIPFAEQIGNRLFPKSSFYYATKRKPRILLVYDFKDWILWKWAKHINITFGSEYDIVLISLFHAEADINYSKQLTEKVDFIHLLLPHPFRLFKKIAPLKPIITTIHHWIDGEESYSDSISGSTYIVTGSKQWKERLVDRAVSPERITVVHSGVEDCFFDETKPLLCHSNRISIGFFAKISSNESDRKGTRHFLRIAERIKDLHLEDRFRLVISGPGWNDIVSTMIGNNIETIYFPYTDADEMPSLYRSLDVYLVLSDVEGGPATVVEAMASGCLVFSTNVGVVGEVIKNGETGVLIDSSRPDEIIKLLLYYNSKQKLKETICSNAKTLAYNRMRFKETLAPLEKLYSDTKLLCRHVGTGILDTEHENVLTTEWAAEARRNFIL